MYCSVVSSGRCSKCWALSNVTAYVGTTETAEVLSNNEDLKTVGRTFTLVVDVGGFNFESQRHGRKL